MKTQEELNLLRVEYETLTNKLKELSDGELKLVTGGEDDTSTECICEVCGQILPVGVSYERHYKSKHSTAGLSVKLRGLDH